MLAKRIIPCLDVRNGAVVKGKRFKDLRYVDNPARLAARYNDEGADEIVFLDIFASKERRNTAIAAVKEVARQIFIPFTVGGGIWGLEDMRDVLKAGADKVSINTAAVKNPGLIGEAAERFGSQCIVVAIDALRKGAKWEVFVSSGCESAGRDAVEWARTVEMLGAGEILLTSIDRDGTREGYDIELTRQVSRAVNIPVIASGGANDAGSMAEVLTAGEADAALAASIFHSGECTIGQVKKQLAESGVEVRL